MKLLHLNSTICIRNKAEDRQIFEDNEKAIISDMKLNILQQEEKIAQSNIENSAKLSEASSKLDKLEANLDLDCKDYTTKLQKIEVIIKDKDERIKELESVLNKLIDQRHILE